MLCSLLTESLEHVLKNKGYIHPEKTNAYHPSDRKYIIIDNKINDDHYKKEIFELYPTKLDDALYLEKCEFENNIPIFDSNKRQTNLNEEIIEIPKQETADSDHFTISLNIPKSIIFDFLKFLNNPKRKLKKTNKKKKCRTCMMRNKN